MMELLTTERLVTRHSLHVRQRDSDIAYIVVADALEVEERSMMALLDGVRTVEILQEGLVPTLLRFTEVLARGLVIPIIDENAAGGVVFVPSFGLFPGVEDDRERLLPWRAIPSFDHRTTDAPLVAESAESVPETEQTAQGFVREVGG